MDSQATTTQRTEQITVDVWFDVVCPWCLLGKRRFEAALSHFEHGDAVAVRWRSFELDPESPGRGELTIPQRMQRDLGLTPAQAEEKLRVLTELAAEAGLDYRLTEARPSNSFDAHRLMHYAESVGRGEEMRERLSIAYATESAIVSESSVLVQLATEAGLDDAATRHVLAGGDFSQQVRADEAQARQLGVTGVPTFVFAQRYALSGAQPVETFHRALTQVWQEATA
ncbi:DsbA family oxidoreductase [Lipingzhangella sp. LS1_29]|uniref:DsbA family oxidoreductase n=1 Tax=Lipingzhangella rawalii TaxID=2055835 RepID=A0ABU2HAN0_9ACTN|nr:DsbA family oxidoreductase [Lipingzhangella rawalii]MDS1272378.1 DsbA family oxidoreductase [Lipingzhangella rawalii]